MNGNTVHLLTARVNSTKLATVTLPAAQLLCLNSSYHTKCTVKGLAGTEFVARNTPLTITQCLYQE
jgi:hypothetical protein